MPLDIPTDYYVQINMEGFEDIVDAVGGVTVQNDQSSTVFMAMGTSSKA